MQGFEGWQRRQYDEHIESIFEHQIPAKFLQHYDIMEWVDAASPVALPGPSHPGAVQAALPAGPLRRRLRSRARTESTVVVTRGTDPDTATTKSLCLRHR